MAHKVTIISPFGCRERKSPTINSAFGATLQPNTVHYADELEIVNSEGMWIKLQSGWYIATYYNGKRKADITVHTIEVFSDGTISIDGGEKQ